MIRSTHPSPPLAALPLPPSAQAEGVDVMVAGSRGMGAISRSLLGLVGMGSVSDYMSHHSPCPLLVVKGVAGGGDCPDLSGGPPGTPILAPMGTTLRPITEGDGSEARSMQ